jgi:glycosyltransferase involved in cell wall biosynthesis
VKILIFHQHFNTPQKGGPLRSYYLAKALVDAGMKVIVITAQDVRAHKIEFFDGIEVHYLPVRYENRFGFYRRIYSFFSYNIKALRLAHKFHDADLCYAISVPLTIGLIALRLKSKYNIPYIFEVGDLWPDAPIELGFVKNVFARKSMYRLEKRIYQQAKSIVALSPAIADRISAKTSNKNITVIPNMADTEYFPVASKDASLVKKYNVDGKFVASYIGAIGYANGLDFLLACAKVTQANNVQIQYLICGEGAMLPALKKAASLWKLKNVTFLPFATRDQVKEIFNITDVSVVCYRPEKILETGSPNKFFDALAAGKPVAINFEGWIKDEIEKNECGFYINPSKPEDFTYWLKRLEEDRGLLSQYQTNARKLAEEKYSRKMLSEKFLGLIHQSFT